ncbi:terminase small subunit [Paenibacillus provencensis]|uniref:Terminase small subunit n=1 Tax=Paenibacillus provencensis TaxID=441151 RepID=A0ABW3PMV7_9BACL|nr:terminase small subunit [Paenibacillus sp. MER 78]MCM3130958.1 terminase small subunit [Paenibacillus sp. MER 78]
MALTAKQKKFAEEYIVDLNATQAAIRSGYSEKTAKSIGQENLTKPDLQEYIQHLMDERSKRTEITADMVLERWWNIATADPNELVHLRRLNCRFCHGINNEFQWVDEEEYEERVKYAENEAMAESLEKNVTVAPKIPSKEGGFGFNKLADPNPECPHCLGEGKADLHMEDTKKLRGGARLLYAGIKQTQAGIEIKMHDQAKALENVARHLGMFKDRTEVDLKVSKKLEEFFS